MSADRQATGTGGMRPPDDYEASYMAGEDVIYRDKIKVPKKFFLLFLLPIVVQIGSFALAASQGKPIPAAALAMLPVTALILSLVALLFAVLRITVTRREVHVQYGLFGPKIPVSKIEDCRAVKYNWMEYGGWGIRRGADGSWAYNMVGDAGRAVRIEWVDEKGKQQTTLVASPDPEALARAIQEARGVALGSAIEEKAAGAGARIAAGAGGKRVASEPRADEFEAESEASAEAQAEAAEGADGAAKKG
jgi:hypothetical protein